MSLGSPIARGSSRAVRRSCSLLFAALSLSPSLARAQEPTSPDPPPQRVFAPAFGEEEHDTPRVRFGVSPAGVMFTAEGSTEPLAGLDLRLGLQYSDRLAIFLTPHLALGPAQDRGGDVSTFIANIGGTADVDFTFGDRLYLGAGVGAADISGLVAAAFHLRLGGYPLVHKSAADHRRFGLQMGGESRIYLTSDKGRFTPALEVGATLGFEMF
jgi:hypothetical protein